MASKSGLAPVMWGLALGGLLGACAGPRLAVTTVPLDETNAPLLAHISSGYMGCPPDEIIISDISTAQFDLAPERLFETWTARCRGAAFYCSSHRTSLSCAQERSPEP